MCNQPIAKYLLSVSERIMSEVITMEVEEEEENRMSERTPKTSKKARKDVSLYSKNKRVKGIVLSVTKPSYTLQRGRGTSNTEFESLRWLNRNRLSCLLQNLMRKHNWDEAAGVLSVLLKGTCSEKSASKNRTKYVASMEVLKRSNFNSINPKRFQHIFETWMKKIGTTKGWRTKDRFVVQLEYILFCLKHGNIEDAHQAAICAMQEREFGNEPVSNLVVGLTFCQEWYAYFQKEFPAINLDGFYTPNQSEMLESKFDMSIDISEGHVEEEIQEANYAIQRDSDTSVRNDKEIGSEKVSVDADMQRENPHQTFARQGFYVHSGESDGLEQPSFSGHASIFYTRGLEPWLLPSRLPNAIESVDEFLYVQKKIHNDTYKGALKYLRLALNSTPPMLEALLPLVQLLLLGDHVKEAIDEVDNFCKISETALHLRLKATLLEHFDGDSHVNLPTCYENVLKKDPTCTHSLSKLLSMHRNGDYNSEKLLGMIALHLDATYAEPIIWKEFASCFLRLFLCEEDRISCLNGYNDGEFMQRQSVVFNSNRGIIAGSIMGKEWRFRCRWWMTRHFSQNMFVSEVAAGDFQLVTYKAASACHLYGRDFEYVVKVFNCIEKEQNRDLITLLQMHMQNSVGFNCDLKKNDT